MLDILRELLPVIYTPMAQLFTRARVGTHFHVLFKTLKRIIKASESSTTGPARYACILDQFTSELYSFLHESAVNDDHSIADALHWLVVLLAFAKEETIDLDALLDPLDDTTYNLLVKELDQVVAFYEYRRELKELAELDDSDQEEESSEEDQGTPKQKTKSDAATLDNGTNESLQHQSTGSGISQEVPRPDLVYIPLLVCDFVSMVKSQLGHLESSTPTTTNATNCTSTTDSPLASRAGAGTSHN